VAFVLFLPGRVQPRQTLVGVDLRLLEPICMCKWMHAHRYMYGNRIYKSMQLKRCMSRYWLKAAKTQIQKKKKKRADSVIVKVLLSAVVIAH